MDSAGLGALIGGIRRAREHGGEVAVACSRPTLTRLLHTTGFDRIVPVTETLDAAVAGRRPRRSAERRQRRRQPGALRRRPGGGPPRGGRSGPCSSIVKRSPARRVAGRSQSSSVTRRSASESFAALRPRSSTTALTSDSLAKPSLDGGLVVPPAELGSCSAQGADDPLGEHGQHVAHVDAVLQRRPGAGAGRRRTASSSAASEQLAERVDLVAHLGADGAAGSSPFTRPQPAQRCRRRRCRAGSPDRSPARRRARWPRRRSPPTSAVDRALGGVGLGGRRRPSVDRRTARRSASGAAGRRRAAGDGGADPPEVAVEVLGGELADAVGLVVRAGPMAGADGHPAGVDGVGVGDPQVAARQRLGAGDAVRLSSRCSSAPSKPRMA